MPVRRRPGRHRRSSAHLLLALVLALGSALGAAPRAAAEPRGFLTIDKSVTGWRDGHPVDPGDRFFYTVLITCSNSSAEAGCTGAALTDPLPDGLLLDGAGAAVTVLPSGSGTVTVDGDTVRVSFTEPLSDPAGGRGIGAGHTITVQIPVRVDPAISAELDGRDLTNTATVDADNTDPASDEFTVVPSVPIELEASTRKRFSPGSGVAAPGTETTLRLTGGNASNVPVDRIVMTDPTDPPGPFAALGLTGRLDVSLPSGAEQVRLDCHVNGAWVNGVAGPPPAVLPAGVLPEACRGVRVHFLSTAGGGIPPRASGSIDIGLEQRPGIADGTIGNEVSTIVGVGGDTSEPATDTDDYVVSASDIDLEASKSFSPDAVAAGQQSTVTLGASNTSSRTLDSLRITEPGGQPNMFDNGLSFDGWTEATWPAGATGASITYTFADGGSQTLTAGAADSLPAPPAGRRVTGFAVEFTGPIVPGADTRLRFGVTAAAQQAAEEVRHPNTVAADSTAPGGFRGHDTARDTLTTIVQRLGVEVSKRVSPEEIWSIPGENATVQLGGRVLPFPDSTTNAHRIVVSDPADPADSAWWDAFAPSSVVATPVPDGATLTVEYFDTRTGSWLQVPGMANLAGPQVFSGDLPAEVIENARGIRFGYDSAAGFPPGTRVAPNLNFALRAPLAGSDRGDIRNCAAADASAGGGVEADRAVQAAPCASIDLKPPTPGAGDLVSKRWDDPKAVGERTGNQLGATVGWSTGGRSGLDQVIVSDPAAPSAANLAGSVFDTFDLVRVDRVSAAADPLLSYDRVARVELFSRSADAWIPAPGDPCPAGCDGTFPGYTVPDALRGDVIGVRLVVEESPTRGQRLGNDPNAPRVGSGVARSFRSTRPLHLVFQLRDERRSDPDVPVVADAEYNVAGRTGQVRNTVRADGLVGGQPVAGDTDADIATITEVPVTVSLQKTWTGGPLGVPPAGSTARFPDDYPTGRLGLDAHNTTPRQIDRLTITEPGPSGGTDPFDRFNLRDFVAITDPAAIGADQVTVRLALAGGGSRELTRQQALDASEAELADVVGYTVVYTGRIDAGAHAVVSADTRLRQHTRSGDDPITGPATVPNRAATLAEDLVGYPGVDPVTSTDEAGAGIALQTTGIGLSVGKSFAPSSQTEPDRGPVTMTLTGRPSGPSRTNWMRLTDDDSTFFNAYDFAGFGPFAFTAPIDRVQVDAYVGGTLRAAGDTVVRDGGGWVNGTPATTPVLPGGVSPEEVTGLRFTFTRADGTIWENPSTPQQAVAVQVRRRTTLRTGGPVPSDLAGSAAAPGED
ncbi:MAG: hypothetical protein QM582_13560, partial [Micropruina sp.]|uniref:hypothetical protein n=1 Tax=Micropruina sp. TaxID=2737536 RepID=UPI0039E4F85F